METDDTPAPADVAKLNTEEKFSDFKKPLILVGKVGKLPRTALPDVRNKEISSAEVAESATEPKGAPKVPVAIQSTEKLIPLNYKEPKWSALPPKESNYKLEVLKSGLIIKTIDLTTKPFFVFGRLTSCDVVMAHPTISRFHMVIQYKAEDDEEHPCGLYLFDLNSTHGTFLNKKQLKPHHYVRMMVGHMFKLGTSTRNFILQGPDEEQEEESKLSLTEIKEQTRIKLEERKRKVEEAKAELEKLQKEEEKKVDGAGISWGMGDDAEEETDLSENPYAATTNEELYLDDPKKTLRGFFEREGATLEYDCEERGVGQFVCRVELPIDDPKGRPLVAEVVHKGKKKETVIQCALEACRIIDRHGLLRQARHESRKRKEKNWQSEDFYDSDDDTFLDRTGKVEEKRKKRMARYGGAESEKTGTQQDDIITYEGLLKKMDNIKNEISTMEAKLASSRNKLKAAQSRNANGDDDDLDAYMESLSKSGSKMSQKADISKLKLEILALKSELGKTERLADIAKPAAMPELIRQPTTVENSEENAPKVTVKKLIGSVVYGKRLKLKSSTKERAKSVAASNADGEFIEEVESDDDEDDRVKGSAAADEEPKLNDKNVEPAEESSMKPKADADSKKGPTRVFGPMRPPENYVIPESYFEQETDRDLPEISEDNEIK